MVCLLVLASKQTASWPAESFVGTNSTIPANVEDVTGTPCSFTSEPTTTFQRVYKDRLHSPVRQRTSYHVLPTGTNRNCRTMHSKDKNLCKSRPPLLLL